MLNTTSSTRKSTAATVVVVSSASHFDSHSDGIYKNQQEINDPSNFISFSTYGQSKLANVLFAQELNRQLSAINSSKNRKILVNSCDPGFVHTQMARDCMGVLLQYAPNSFNTFMDEHFVKKLAWAPEQGALTQVYLAIGPDLIKRGVTGKYFHPIARETGTDKRHAHNRTLQTHLWADNSGYYFRYYS